MGLARCVWLADDAPCLCCSDHQRSSLPRPCSHSPVELPSLQRAIAPGLEQQQQQLAPSGGPASIGRASIGTASVGGSSTRDLDVSADTPLIRTSTSGGRPLSAPALGATEGREAAQRSGRSAPGAAGQAAGAGGPGAAVDPAAAIAGQLAGCLHSCEPRRPTACSLCPHAPAQASCSRARHPAARAPPAAPRAAARTRTTACLSYPRPSSWAWATSSSTLCWSDGRRCTTS